MPLPIPQGLQREVVYLSTAGHTVVLGTAGSGKTTMAILRAAFLSHPSRHRSGGGPTLLLTFNKTLARYIRHLAAEELANVRVENFHLFARGYLNFRGRMPRRAIIGNRLRASLIDEAVSKRTLPHDRWMVERGPEFFSDEIKWIQAHGLATLNDYVSMTRIGRGHARLSVERRPSMWEVYDDYRRRRAEAGFLYDLDDIATAVGRELEGDDTPRLYRHVVIDEGQDLSPEMLRALAKAIPSDGSLSFFGDVAQQIYGHRMSFRSAGLPVKEVLRFAQNYRNTKEIADLALAISRMPYYAGAADLVPPHNPVAEGPRPSLIGFDDVGSELEFVVRRAVRFAETRSVAILCRKREQVALVRERCAGRGTELSEDQAFSGDGPHLHYGTIHASKGLEFDVVFLPFMSSETFPHPSDVAQTGRDEAVLGDGRLLYVGVTRARTELVISHVGRPTELLPSLSHLYVRTKR